MHPIEEILGSPDTFLKGLFDQVRSKRIQVEELYMDHICYRVEDIEDYNLLKDSLIQFGKLLSDKVIGGRPISIIELDQPYTYNQRAISIIELPSPKAGSPYTKGYEHVEFVIKNNLEDFVAFYPQVKFDLKGMNKRINRDARIQLSGCSVKFHEHSLKYVIEDLES